jgi:hypothetical protein
MHCDKNENHEVFYNNIEFACNMLASLRQCFHSKDALTGAAINRENLTVFMHTEL